MVRRLGQRERRVAVLVLGAWVCAVLEQQLHDRGKALLCCCHERAPSLLHLELRIGTVLKEQPGDLNVAARRRREKACPLAHAAMVDCSIGHGADDVGHLGGVAVERIEP